MTDFDVKCNVNYFGGEKLTPENELPDYIIIQREKKKQESKEKKLAKSKKKSNEQNDEANDFLENIGVKLNGKSGVCLFDGSAVQRKINKIVQTAEKKQLEIMLNDKDVNKDMNRNRKRKQLIEDEQNEENVDTTNTNNANTNNAPLKKRRKISQSVTESQEQIKSQLPSLENGDRNHNRSFQQQFSDNMSIASSMFFYTYTSVMSLFAFSTRI